MYFFNITPKKIFFKKKCYYNSLNNLNNAILNCKKINKFNNDIKKLFHKRCKNCKYNKKYLYTYLSQ